MLFKSRATKTLDQALASVEETRRWSQPKVAAGTLTDADRERVREELDQAAALEERSRGESRFSLLGPALDMLKRFMREGRFFMTDQEYMAELRSLKDRAEAFLAKLSATE